VFLLPSHPRLGSDAPDPCIERSWLWLAAFAERQARRLNIGQWRNLTEAELKGLLPQTQW
jgi:hypothetical protein